MSNRVKELIKQRGLKLTQLAQDMDKDYAGFYRMLNKPTLKFLEQLENFTGINTIEFQEAPKGFMHLYDDKDGKWLGIIPKPATTYHATPQELASIDRGLEDLKAERFIPEEEAEREIEELWEK